ncbi:hypothetical protein Droror1_Dr00011324 [Drosera rotundifolia]
MRILKLRYCKQVRRHHRLSPVSLSFSFVFSKFQSQAAGGFRQGHPIILSERRSYFSSLNIQAWFCIRNLEYKPIHLILQTISRNPPHHQSHLTTAKDQISHVTIQPITTLSTNPTWRNHIH